MKRLTIPAAMAMALMFAPLPVLAATQAQWNTCAGSDNNAAVNACTRILAGKENAANRAMAFFNRGVAYVNLGRYADALTEYTQSIKLNASFARAWEERGVAYNWLQRYTEAVADFDQAIRRDKKSARAFEQRSVAWGGLKEWDKAIADASEAIRLDPKYTKAYRERGVYYAWKNQHTQAISDLTRAIQLKSDYVDAIVSRAWSYRSANDLDRALADARRAISLAPGDNSAKEVLERVQKEIEERDYRIALKDCEGSDVAAAIKACTSYLRLADLSGFQRANALMKRAGAYEKSGDLARAIADYSEILRGNPNHFDALKGRAFAYRAQKDYPRAIADYDDILKSSPRNAEILSQRAHAHYSRGNYGLTRIDAVAALEADAGHTGSMLILSLLNYLEGKHGDAVLIANMALTKNDKDAFALGLRAMARSAMGEREAARADIDRALQLMPDNPTLIGERAIVKAEAGDYVGALIDANYYVQKAPDLANSYRARGYVYMLAGKRDLARDDFKKALALWPEYRLANEMLARLELMPDGSQQIADNDQQQQQQQHQTVLKDNQQQANLDDTRTDDQIDVPLGRRVALVIGNSAYANTGALTNPLNDATDVAAKLKGLGFEVIEGFDLDKRGMDNAFRSFARTIKGADAALFYYAGHAMQFEGVNYLMPVDAKLADEADLPYEMSKLDDVLADMNRVNGVRIAVLDACRNNPLEEQLKRSISMVRGTAVERGLARIARPEGLLVAYSTQAGKTAADGSGRNSPFTSAFLKNIDTAGLEVGLLFRRVATAVHKQTAGEQLPELSMSLLGEFYFRPRQ